MHDEGTRMIIFLLLVLWLKAFFSISLFSVLPQTGCTLIDRNNCVKQASNLSQIKVPLRKTSTHFLLLTFRDRKGREPVAGAETRAEFIIKMVRVQTAEGDKGQEDPSGQMHTTHSPTRDCQPQSEV